MNFVSHYYFERYVHESERVLGSILPDLLKNADKSYSFQPQRFEEVLFSHPLTRSISEGWYRHVEIDKIWHNCDFFLTHSHNLRKIIDPVVKDLPIRASFLAHIAIEVLLDHVVVVDKMINLDRLYEHLEHSNRKAIQLYLEQIGLLDTAKFFKFFDRFVESRYMFDYEQIENVSKSLFNICRRVWSFDLQAHHVQELTSVLREYRDQQLQEYKDVFQYIQHKLTYLS